MKANTVGLLVYKPLFQRGRQWRVSQTLDMTKMSSYGHSKGIRHPRMLMGVTMNDG